MSENVCLEYEGIILLALTYTLCCTFIFEAFFITSLSKLMPSDKDWDLMMTDRISIEIIESTKHWNVKDEVFNNEIEC